MKSRYKLLLMALAFASVGAIAYAWVDLQAAPVCQGEEAQFDPQAPILANGWGFDAANTRAVPISAETLGTADIPRLKLQWAFRFPLLSNKARSQPAVTADTIYVGSQRGWIYALGRQSGCVRWKSFVGAEVRTAITLGEARPGGERRLFFGDFFGHAQALDAATGKRIWKVPVDTHRAATVTGTPVLHEGRLYVPVSSYEVALPALPFYRCCTFRGSVLALDAASGERLWQTYTTEVPQPRDRNALFMRRWGPSGAPIWSAPTIDAARGRLYVGTGENYSQPTNAWSDAILALDLADGRMVWSRQLTPNDAWNMSCVLPGGINCPKNAGKDLDFGASPVLVAGTDGREVLVAGQKSGMVYGLDPDHEGALRWQRRLGRGGALGGVHWGMAARGGVVFVPISDYLKPIPRTEKHRSLKIPVCPRCRGSMHWMRPPERCCGAHRLRRPALIQNNATPGLSAAITALPGAIFAATLDGRLQAYDPANGRLQWETPTAQAFRAVDGRMAKGGAVDSGGPIVAGRQVIVNSGYGLFSQAPGNVLLVYTPAEH